uniref:UPAR/Ly6 domain-containing protein n=1 Tax=Cyclopterus lumpus TaxID=8103 RepID=A0A8C2XA03_CYCLU
LHGAIETIIHSLLPAVSGLKCFTCWSANPGTCTVVWNCPEQYDRCNAENMITKECMRSDVCNIVDSLGVRCCAEDLCNGAKHAGVFAPLLVPPVAIITLFCRG